MTEEPLADIGTFRVAELRELLACYRVTMPARATKQQLYDRLRICMLAHAIRLRKPR